MSDEAVQLCQRPRPTRDEYVAVQVTTSGYVVHVVGPFPDRATADAFVAEIGDCSFDDARWHTRMVMWPDEVRSAERRRVGRQAGAPHELAQAAAAADDDTHAGAQ